MSHSHHVDDLSCCLDERQRALLPRLADYRVRQCTTVHGCALCDRDIMRGDRYHDGGYGRRAHVSCVMGWTAKPHGAADPFVDATYAAYDNFIAEAAKECACCASCWSVPCGGCTAGGICDAMACTCTSRDEEDFYA